VMKTKKINKLKWRISKSLQSMTKPGHSELKMMNKYSKEMVIICVIAKSMAISSRSETKRTFVNNSILTKLRVLFCLI